MVISLVFILAIPLGVFSAVKKDSLVDKVITTGLFFLYSLPSFWIGTMLLVFFTNPEYGMNWFEGAGLGSLSATAPFWDRFWETIGHLILPVFCLTYGSLAFVSRQVRGSVLNVLNLDYIRTARAKGLAGRHVIWKHAFRNSLFPLITMFARILPAAIAGSVLVEVIFNIPGMGREVFTAITAKDWPVLYTILMLVAILTMLGNLLADILYAYADPRVKFK
jgi:peptide/nickel transport system permease protein